MSRRCRSWRLRPLLHWVDMHRVPMPLAVFLEKLTFAPVRCQYPAEHVLGSKWHCDEGRTGRVWYVKRRNYREER